MVCMKYGFIEGLLLDNRFETVSPLNHGSFGMVFLAKDTTNGDLVAIKCIAKPAATNNSADANINDHLIELYCHARLGRHANIVNLLHSFETDAHMFLVLEFCSMGDLYEAIRLGRGPLETRHVRDFMLQLIGAVEFMHSKGLYHRDIKPENIFLAQDGSMKLGDFGLSTTETCSHESSVGSDRYMAPEQFDPPDTGYSPAQADIWSIGICLLNILFSRNPFLVPSEPDALFGDFVRDKQSLYDVFPAMSKDTFEVLIHALAIDPEKRSLSALRAALERVDYFTSDDDTFDEFCTEDREAVPATVNRQPLRTPSIQSPPVEQGGAFPWAKALQMSPPSSARQLSVIRDIDDDGEELFPEKAPSSWYSSAVESSSLASVIDSALSASIKSMALREPKPRNVARTDSVLSESLPVSASKPISAMSSIFGNKDNNVSKSWSDLWDEEEEEEDARRRFNNRNWSTDSIDEDVTIRPSGLSEVHDPSVTNARTQSPPNGLGVFADGSVEDFSFVSETKASTPPESPIYSPPAKRSVLDKWAALGNRRRAAKVESEDKVVDTRKRTNTVGSWRRGFNIKAFSGSAGLGFGRGNGDWNGNETGVNWNGAPSYGAAAWGPKDNLKETSSAGNVKIRDWRNDHQVHRYHQGKSIDEDDDGDQELGWVGVWDPHM